MGQLGDLADLLLQSVSEVPPLHFYQSSTLAKHCTKLLKYNEYAYNDKPGEVKYIDQSLFDRAFGASQNAIHSAAGLRETQPMGNLPTANPKYVDDLFKQAQESVQKLYEALYPGGYCTKAQKTRDKFTEEMGDARQCDERRAQRLKIMISIQQSKASKGKALTDEWEKATVDVKLSVVDVTVPTSRPILEHEDSRTTARKYHQTMPLHGLVHMLVQERGLSLEYFLTFYLRCEGQQDLTKDGVIFKRLAKEQKLKTAAKEIPIEEPMVKQTALLLPTLELFLVVLEPKEDFIVITHGHDKSLAGKEPDVGYIVKKSNAAHALGKPGTIYRKPKDKKPIHYESLQWDHLHNTGKEYYISPIRQPQVTPFSYIFPAWDSSQGTSDSSQPRASIQNLMTAGSEPYPDPNNTTISAGPKIPCTELPSTFSPIGSGAHDIPRPTLSQRTPVAVSQSISMSLSVTAVTHNEDNTSNSGLITRVGSEGEISFAERPLPLLPNLPARPLSSIFLSDSPETPVQKSSQLAQGLQTSVVPQSSPGRPVLHIQPTRNPIAWTPTLPNPESETGGEEEYWTPIVETPTQLKPYAISLRDDIGASHSGDQVVHTTGAGSVTSPTALPTPNDSELGSPIPLILNTPRPEAKNDYSGTRPQRALNDTQSPGLVKAADIPIKGSPVPASASTLSDAKTSRLSSSASVKALPALPQANYTTPSASTSGTIAAPKPRRSAVTTNQPSTAVKPSTKQVMPPAPDSSEIGSSVSQTPTTADPAFRHGVFKASHRHQPEYTQRSSASLPLGSSRSSGGEASVSATLAPTGSSAQSLADMSHWNANTLVTAYPTPTIKSSSFKSAATLATSVGKVVTEPTHPSRPADEKTLGARVDGLHDKTMYSISNDHELVSSDPHPPTRHETPQPETLDSGLICPQVSGGSQSVGPAVLVAMQASGPQAPARTPKPTIPLMRTSILRAPLPGSSTSSTDTIPLTTTSTNPPNPPASSVHKTSPSHSISSRNHPGTTHPPSILATASSESAIWRADPSPVLSGVVLQRASTRIPNTTAPEPISSTPQPLAETPTTRDPPVSDGGSAKPAGRKTPGRSSTKAAAHINKPLPSVIDPPTEPPPPGRTRKTPVRVVPREEAPDGSFGGWVRNRVVPKVARMMFGVPEYE